VEDQTMGFTLPEKMAIVQAVDSVIHADGIVHSGEINALGQLMKRIDFDSNFIIQSRNIAAQQGLLILNAMSVLKKKNLAMILEDMANADGFFHEKEMTLISDILVSIGIGELSPVRN
jgi:uncharacterized tellurite resistance protein B-like protein